MRLVNCILLSFGVFESPAINGITLRLILPSDLVLFFRLKSRNTDSGKREGDREALEANKSWWVWFELLGSGVERLSGCSYPSGYIL